MLKNLNNRNQNLYGPAAATSIYYMEQAYIDLTRILYDIAENPPHECGDDYARGIYRAISEIENHMAPLLDHTVDHGTD